MTATNRAFDLAIVGGGLAGASLALALRELPLDVALIEAHAPDSAAQPSFDERTTALGNASRRVFEALGLWPQLRAEAASIGAIHVSDAGRYGFARLDARQFGAEALGYVVPNRVLGRELWRSLPAAARLTQYMPARLQSVRFLHEAAELAIEQGGQMHRLSARLVVAADGAHSMVRQAAGIGVTADDYGQVAVVAALRMDRPNDGVAYERFTSAGPMALLPTAQGPATRTLVWAAHPGDAGRLMQLPQPQFLDEWQQAFGWRAGRAVELGVRGRYPLALTRSIATVAPRVVFIGNAAQSLHPVAGQGFNLALRDVAELAEVLSGAAAADIGSGSWLAAYDAGRARDRDGVVRFTDALVRTFSSAHPAVAAMRDAGLLLFDLLPPAKRALSRVSLGFGARTSRLARGLPLVAPAR